VEIMVKRKRIRQLGCRAIRKQGAAVPVSIAEFIPTHTADYRAGVPKVQLASGRYIDRLDMSGWHEAGHAVAFLALGWSIRYLAVASPGAGLVDPKYDWWAGECRADPPPMPDHLHEALQYHAMAVATMAGPVAARAVRIALGLQNRRAEKFHTEIVNEGDAVMLTLAKTFLGIAPADAADFEGALREQATAILIEHRRVYGAMVAALLAHKLLNAAEVAAVWHQGAFDFVGRIGRLAVVEHRADLVADPDLTLPPFLIRARAGCTGSAQSWVDAGTAASRRSVVKAQRSDHPQGIFPCFVSSPK
jgi:hypothetical protein